MLLSSILLLFLLSNLDLRFLLSFAGTVAASSPPNPAPCIMMHTAYTGNFVFPTGRIDLYYISFIFHVKLNNIIEALLSYYYITVLWFFAQLSCKLTRCSCEINPVTIQNSDSWTICPKIATISVKLHKLKATVILHMWELLYCIG